MTASILATTLTGCPPSGNPIEGLLSSLQEKVDGAVTNAAQQGQALLVSAGSQVTLAIDNFESAYATEIGKSIDQVDDAVRSRLDQISSLVDQLETGSLKVVESVVDGSQQLLNSLPFTNKNPQVRSYSPTATAASAGDVHVSISGNFVWASQQGKAVTLEAGGNSLQAAGSTTTRLDFIVPASVFGVRPDGIGFVTLTLTAPYEKGVVVKSTVPGVFRLLVSVLPASPVRSVTLTNRMTVTGQERRTITQPVNGPSGVGWRLNSWADCTDQNDSHAFTPDAGDWRIDVATPAIHYTHRGYEPRSWASIDTVGVSGVAVSGHTRANCFLGISYDSGDITYYVTYDEVRTTTSQSSQTVNVAVTHWGDEVDLPVTQGGWTVHAVLWDGSTHDWSAGETDNPYLRITDNRNSVRISAPAPETFSVVQP